MVINKRSFKLGLHRQYTLLLSLHMITYQAGRKLFG